MTTSGLLDSLLDIPLIRGGNSTLIFNFFFLLKAVLAVMSSMAPTVNPYVHWALTVNLYAHWAAAAVL